MILPGGRFQVFVATRPVDFRKGMDSLAAVVQERLRLDPFSGAVFVFRATRRASNIQHTVLSRPGSSIRGIRFMVSGSAFTAAPAGRITTS